MNRNSRRSHSIDTLFVITLLGLFLIFLLMMLLFSTQAYRTAVEGNQENNNLYTASAYITEKFRQHDSSQSVSLDTLDNLPAFCMTDTIDGTSYVTYIYLLDHQLKELFYCKRQHPFFQKWERPSPVWKPFRQRKHQRVFTGSPWKTCRDIPQACCFIPARL